MLRHSIRLCHLPSTSSFQHHPNTRRFSLSSAIISTSSFLSHSSVTQACQWTLETVHASVGLPWWVTIVGTTVAFKLLTSPLLFASERSLAKYALIKLLVLKRGPEFRAEAEKLAESNALSVDKKRLWIMLAVSPDSLLGYNLGQWSSISDAKVRIDVDETKAMSPIGRPQFESRAHASLDRHVLRDQESFWSESSLYG